ncbi:MAG TPA: hypothetical protein VNN17_01150, partial [Terriglobia bacterium]|nr:hypothetical protein [Terriglobia bacterium]
PWSLSAGRTCRQPARIPPAAPIEQSDVATVRRLLEDGTFDLGSFRNRPELLAKASLYRTGGGKCLLDVGNS